MKKGIVLFVTLLGVVCVNAQHKTLPALSKEEQKMIAYIDANMPRAIELLKESVNINSGTLNIEV